MNCPRCATSPLQEKDRDGVTIDICRECRGIWLDRGELEKLIARAARDVDEARGRTDRDGDRARGRDRDDDDDDRRGGFFSRLGDLFD